ncbi:uncharacterized protein AB675_1738 [Cyphellophora attinorum]|uniref:Uncharacterized protein n=1 Tax=Cyphellophora attinorum TaxID=1664694 RepID=A0A0N0NPL4_9EURO|nr:uncharacterized protein AB675_1738 [Phialophora attinorum]KPI42858.1 hypothetical protein AB675_1738 [Phialophora attinorum]
MHGRPVRLHFLPTFNNDNSLRDNLLSQSEAKSHAARISSTRRKSPNKRSKRPALRLNVATRFANGAVLMRTSLNTVLDPFLDIAGPLVVSDRKALQAYLTANMAIRSPDPSAQSFCPIRDVLLPKFSVSPATVQGILLIVDVWHASTAADDLEVKLSRRRTTLLKLMAAIVNDPTVFAQQHVAMTLSTLATAEHRAGDYFASQCHLKGLVTWLNFHGGLSALKKFSYSSSVMLTATMVTLDFQLFQNEEQVEAALARLVLKRGRRCERLAPYARDTEGYGSGAHDISRSHLATLYLLNGVLQWEDDAFVERLVDQLPTPGEPNSSVGFGALFWLVARAANSRSDLPKGVHPQANIIEFVHLLALTTTEVRRQVAEMMTANIVEDYGGGTERIEIEELNDEVREGAMRVFGSGTASEEAGVGLARTNSQDTVMHGMEEVCPHSAAMESFHYDVRGFSDRDSRELRMTERVRRCPMLLS